MVAGDVLQVVFQPGELNLSDSSLIPSHLSGVRVAADLFSEIVDIIENDEVDLSIVEGVVRLGSRDRPPGLRSRREREHLEIGTVLR